jgi:hypothetical protein
VAVEVEQAIDDVFGQGGVFSEEDLTELEDRGRGQSGKGRNLGLIPLIF